MPPRHQSVTQRTPRPSCQRCAPPCSQAATPTLPDATRRPTRAGAHRQVVWWEELARRPQWYGVSTITQTHQTMKVRRARRISTPSTPPHSVLQNRASRLTQRRSHPPTPSARVAWRGRSRWPRAFKLRCRDRHTGPPPPPRTRQRDISHAADPPRRSPSCHSAASPTRSRIAFPLPHGLRPHSLGVRVPPRQSRYTGFVAERGVRVGSHDAAGCTDR